VEVYQMGGTYEVLSPWAEVDPVPLRGITERLPSLEGRRIGLFSNNKLAGAPILDAVERELLDRYQGVSVARFGRTAHQDVADTPDKQKYEDWVKEVDAVVLAVGD
jgi:hypothetical protein